MPLALDFGTCNTVIARWNEAAQRAELLHPAGLGRRFQYRFYGDPKDRDAAVVPSLITPVKVVLRLSAAPMLRL